MTIVSLLACSLANVRRGLGRLAQQRNLPRTERSHRLVTGLVAARLQEAELLIGGYVERTDDAAGSHPTIRGWAFHR